MHRGYWFNGYGNMFWSWLIPLALILLIAIAVYMIFRNNKTGDQTLRDDNTQSTNRAHEILDERYAKGEIDEEEYKRMKRNLSEK